MNKKLTALAVAAAIAAPMAAQAEAPTVYGYANVFIGSFDNGGGVFKTDELNMGSQDSNVGVKGSADLDYGLKGIYQIEFGIDMSERNSVSSKSVDFNNDGTPDANLSSGTGAITDRDQWVGLTSADYGTLRLGTISNNYKSGGKSIDPLYQTPFQARGFINAQSPLHSGAGPLGGRSTNTVRYDSPRIAGAKVVGNYAFAENEGNVLGVGIHYDMGPIKAHADYLNSDQLDGSAIQVGGAYSMAGFMLGVQYETIDQELGKGGDTITASGSYTLGNTMLAFNFGNRKDNVQNRGDSNGWAVVLDQKLNKKTDVYGGYGSVDYDNNGDDSGWAIGVRHVF